MKLPELYYCKHAQCLRHIFFMPSVSGNLRPFKTDYFLKQAEVIRSQIRRRVWVFHFNNRYLDKNLLVSWSNAMLESPIVVLKFRPFSRGGFM